LVRPDVLDLLDATEMMVATALAIGGGWLSPDGLALAAGCAKEALVAALAELTELGIVKRRADGVPVVAHSLLASRLSEICPPDRVRAIRTALIDVMDSDGPGGAFVAAQIEALADPVLALLGVQICLRRCRACLVLGEVPDALPFLERAERLLQIGRGREI
jgi:hypothetical protein